MAPKRRSTATADSRRVRTFTGRNPPTPATATTSPSSTSATVRVPAPLDSIAAAPSPPSRVVQSALNKIHAPIADTNPRAKPLPRASPQPSATTNGEPLSDLHDSTSTSSADQSPTDNPAVVNTSVAGTRTRLGRGRHHLPPAPSRLNGNLQFTNANERARYAFVSTLPIVQGPIIPPSHDLIESSKKEVLYVQLLLPQPWLILHLALHKLFRPSTPELIRWRVDSKKSWSVLPLI
ncbi:glycogen [starch] synthase-like [Manihot esculenta]|uniref:glycogen [starch] synthase-like n=1 Tax=Manihot esculenta TaxID=3983 RepID=UPI000B5D7B92|nr:glycogen [starch] synthase-like [Manihot esculenta]